MASCITFQTQLTSVMEVLAKAAVAEIAKLVDDKCTFLHLEISRKQNEIDILKRKLVMFENKNAQMQRGLENFMDNTSDVRTSCPHPPGETQFAEIQDGPVPFTVKEERLDEGIWANESPEPIGNAVQYNNASFERQQFEEERQMAHGDLANRKTQNQFNDSHLPGQRREEADGLQFTVKTEKEEDQLEFRQEGCRHGPGKQNPLPPEFAMDERDNQLWSSIIEGSDDLEAGFPDFSSVVEEYSNTFPQHSDTQTLSAAKPNSAAQSSAQRPCNGMYAGEFPDVPQSSTFPSKSQVPHTHQEGQKEELFAQRNSHASHMREPSEHPERDFAAPERSAGAEPHNSLMAGDFRLGTNHHHARHSGSAARGFLCSLCGKTFNRLPQLKLHQQSHKRKRMFWCTVCGKTFQCSSHLSIHYRTHTGEKPYVCGTCGKRFTQQSSLRVHQRTHSGERPYSCAHCGKTFILMHHLKRHRIIHTYS